MDSEQQDQKLYDFLSGHLTGPEMKEVQAWIGADENNRHYFQQFKADFLKMRWGLRTRLITGKVDQIQNAIRQRRRFKIFRNMAACVAILLGIGGGIFLYLQRTSSETNKNIAENRPILPGKPQAVLILSSGQKLGLDSLNQELYEQNGTSIQIAGGALSYQSTKGMAAGEAIYNRIIIPRGGEYALQMADGTKVWLNAATEFRYPVNFSGEIRKVYLKGEAYFEVAKDSLRPFVVMADEVRVKVYGTKFNVNNYTSEKIQAVLVEGAVGMESQGREVRLKPGQKGETAGEKIDVAEVDVASYIAWKNGDFVFDDELLEDIMDQVARWYDVDVFYSRQENRKVRLSGDMKRYKEVQSLLYYFEKISDIHFTIKGRTIVVE